LRGCTISGYSRRAQVRKEASKYSRKEKSKINLVEDSHCGKYIKIKSNWKQPKNSTTRIKE
jgi:hypothetical protein